MALIDDIAVSAEWVARALTSSGYSADFSPASIFEVERFFDENTANGQPCLQGLLGTGLGSRLFAVGCYLGEVVRLSVGGDWLVDDDDPQGEINVTLRLASGAEVWPVQRVMKRLRNGPEESVVGCTAALGVPFGGRSNPT